MRKVFAFLHVSVDGYFTGADGDLGWTRHDQDPEYSQFADENARRDSVLVFGRVTYQMMAGFWPSPMALEREPVMAGHMNAAPKIVFSRSLPSADWNNTSLLKGDAVNEVQKLKQQDGYDVVLLGSGSIVGQLAEAGLIDEFQLLITPIALGAGRTYSRALRKRSTLSWPPHAPSGMAKSCSSTNRSNRNSR